jgi:hypothetical protein
MTAAVNRISTSFDDGRNDGAPVNAVPGGRARRCEPGAGRDAPLMVKVARVYARHQ